jgi:hypothetical protein
MNCIAVEKETIACTWCGRHDDNVSVTGATSIEEARTAALTFFRSDEENGCDDEGITLDEGILIKWAYDEPQPDDWQDCYVFRSVDRWQPDQREWWEK